jgi:uncharacterized protein (TIGR03086 family)
MEAHETLHRAIDQAARLVDDLGDDDLAKPTPCDQFDVKALLNHLVASTDGLANAATGQTWNMATYGQDLVGDDPKGAFARAATRLRDATATSDTLERTWKMPFGESPGSRAIPIGIIELAQHAWDLGKATGRTDLDEELGATALELAQQNMPPDDQRSPETFGKSVPVADDAPAPDRLAGFLGRQP